MIKIEAVRNEGHCGLCGAPFPLSFTVSNKDWKFFVPKHLQKGIICIQCFLILKMIVLVDQRPGLRQDPEEQLIYSREDFGLPTDRPDIDEIVRG